MASVENKYRERDKMFLPFNPKIETQMNNNQQSLQGWCKHGNISENHSEDLGSNPEPCINLKLVETKTDKFHFEQIVKNYHTYKPENNLVGRRIDWLIKNEGEIIGAIGVGSSVMAMKPRDDFIGWNKNQRLKNLTKTCTNWRYCLTKKTKYSSKILKLFLREARKEWKKKFGQNLVLIETLVEPPYKGTCYIASGWKMVGKTKGLQFEWKKKEEILESDNVVQKFMEFNGKRNEDMWKVVSGKSTPKYIFVKPLHKLWRKELLMEEKND